MRGVRLREGLDHMIVSRSRDCPKIIVLRTLTMLESRDQSLESRERSLDHVIASSAFDYSFLLCTTMEMLGGGQVT